MIGHGSPSSSSIDRAPAAPRLPRIVARSCAIVARTVLILCALLAPATAAAQDPPAGEPVRFRNILKAERASPDALRIVTKRASLIFAPGEQFAFELHPQLDDMAPGTSLDIQASLSPVGRHEAVWSAPQRLEVPIAGAPAVTIEVPMPKAEGVYTVRISATRSPGFRNRFFPGGATPSAERSFDVVVLDSQPVRGSGDEPWNTVLEIDPTSPRWWERLPSWTQLRRFPAMNFRQLGSARMSTVDLPYGRFVELPPTTTGAEPHWQAYSLPLEAVGVPHLLEIEYPANDQHFGLSIIEPDAAGVVEGSGCSGGVYVEGFGRQVGKQTHRMLFWPRTESPLLVVTNQHPTAAAMFGHIRVLKRTSMHLTTTPNVNGPAHRLVAAYIARPRLFETFAASGGSHAKTAGLVPSDAKTPDDWQTIYESATRLSETVRYGGYNSAIVSILADGATLYPSEHFSDLPSHDTGHAASDFPNRDCLELLLRVFDRDGLALVPALQFAAPLPELETLRRGSDPQTSGLEWVGPNGRTWVDANGTRQGLAPYYNLLDNRVQEAILKVIGELVERYGHHASFAGACVQLSANGYMQLPPLDWGLDDATMARFERDTGIELAATGANRFAARHALLTREHANAWRQWRVEQVSKFYGQLAALLRENGSDHQGRLILTLEESFSHPSLAARVRPAILGLSNRVDAALLDAGIDRATLQGTPGVVLCPTRYIECMAPLSERAVDLELNEAFAAWPKLTEQDLAPGALLYHRPLRRQLASFQPHNTWKMNGPLQLVSQPVAHGAAIRQPYVLALLQHDPTVLLDGGELLPPSQDESLREAREIVRQLPTAADVSDMVKQPVTVRTYAERDGITVLVLNASPWEATADITLDVARTSAMKPLPTTSEAPARESRTFSAGQRTWPVTLEPYAIRAVRIESLDVHVLDITARSAPAAQTELDSRLRDFEKRDLTAPRSYPALTNPSFEPLNQESRIVGWTSTSALATAELDAKNPRDGATSVHFRSKTGAAALQSDPFPMPPTGQLAITVYTRAPKMDHDSELRIIIEAANAGQQYRRAQVIHPIQSPDNSYQSASDAWTPKAILVNDLPLESGGDIRVRFELTGAGEVWLDAVNAYALLFPLEWYRFGEAERLQFIQLKHAAKTSLEEGRIVDCTRVMEKYWPRFVAEYIPTVQVAARPAVNPRPTSPPRPDKNEQPPPGIGDHIKRVFPGFK